MIISLWMCKNAIYKEGYIKCSKGHNIGKVHPMMVKKGQPLICMICQNCPDADIMGEDIPHKERGW